MSCTINAGIGKECGHGFGGLKEVKVGNFADISAVAYDSNNVITGVTLASGATVYDLQFEKDSGQLLEELQKGGSSFINQTINMQFANITAAKREVIDALSQGTFFFFCKLSDNYWYLAGNLDYSAGLEANTGSIDSGTAQADFAGATLAFVGGSTKYANQVLTSVVESL